MTKRITAEWSSWDRPPQIRTEVIEYPDDHSLHFEPNQQLLRIKNRNGQDMAVFRGMSRYVTEGISYEVRATDQGNTNTEGSTT